MRRIILILCAILMAIVIMRVHIENTSNINLDETIKADISASIPDAVTMPAPTPIPTPEPTTIPTPEPTPTPIPEPEDPFVYYYTEEDVITLAKVMYREAGGILSDTEVACVGWVACNRYDSGISYFDAESITSILTQPYQFAWIPDTPIEGRFMWLAEDVLMRWNSEKNTGESCCRVLPAEYLYFHGDGVHNWFRIEYEHNGQYWDYSLPSPYES